MYYIVKRIRTMIQKFHQPSLGSVDAVFADVSELNGASTIQEYNLTTALLKMQSSGKTKYSFLDDSMNGTLKSAKIFLKNERMYY